jgi:hypothetical protein
MLASSFLIPFYFAYLVVVSSSDTSGDFQRNEQRHFWEGSALKLLPDSFRDISIVEH